MKAVPLFALLLAAFTFPVFAADDDEERVPTQAEMNQQAAEEFESADAKLNAVYKKVKAAQDDDGAAKLKVAQKAWLAYRDAEAALEATPNEGGSIYPLVFANTKTRITKARTKELEAILDGDDENTDANGNPYTGEQNPEGADDPNM